MALKATIFKADLQVSDLQRDYYHNHNLTLARHPSETDERMMVRLLAFALNAHPDLAFTKGLSADDEPDLWRKELHGAIAAWIDVGLPDEKRIRKACSRAEHVAIYAYGERTATIWWQQNESKLQRFDNLSVIYLPNTERLAALATRNMQLSCTIQDGDIWLAGDTGDAAIEPIQWYGD